MEEVNDVSSNDIIDDVQSFLNMELEALKSIYLNEINFEEDVKSTNISIDLHPATADKVDQQYVRITLQFVLSDEYPDEIPKIQIRNPRGLSEEKLNSILKELLTIAEVKKGNSMLFEMIEAAKEHLTAGNRPCGECAICLYGFSDGDIFTKTECYHYFHSHCLARYAKNFQQNSEDDTDPKSKCSSDELLCPMCRVPIQFSGCEEEFPPPESSDESSLVLTKEIVELQNKMARLFQKQVEKGGIIDIEAEKNKYLIEISNVPTRASNGEKAENATKCTADDPVSDDAPTPQPEVSEQVDSPVKERENFRGQKRQNFRGRNHNYKYSNETQGNQYRHDSRYNRHSYNDSRGHQYRGMDGRYSDKFEHGYRKYPHNRGAQRESSENRDDENSQPTGEIDDNDVRNYSPFCDDTSSAAEEQRRENRYKPKFSPRRNRGYMRRGNSNTHYDGRTRPDRSKYVGRQNSNESDRCNFNPTEEDRGVSEELEQKERTPYEGNRKFNYKYNRPSYENDRERYQGNRNAQRGTRRGYGKRDNFYDSKHPVKDYYKKYEPKQPHSGSRNWNYQEREQVRDRRPKYDSADSSRPQSSRNSARDAYSKHSEEYSADSAKADDKNKTHEIDSSQVSVITEVQDNTSNSCQNPLVKESTINCGKDLPSFSQETSSEIREKFQVENGLAIPAVMKEKPQGSLKTAVNPPPGFANPMKKVIYGLQGANPPPGFNRS